MYDIFISYATKDGLELAEKISNLIRSEYMLTPYFSNISDYSGEQIDLKIKNALQASTKVLFVLTPEAIKSKWVQGELGIALETKLDADIIICRRSDVKKGSLPITIINKEHLEFENFESLVPQLNKLNWGIVVVIPVAGKGSGLYPFNRGMPKVLLPVREKPLLYHIIDKLDPKYFSKVVILTGYFKKMIEYYVDIYDSKINIECVETKGATLPLALKNMNIKSTFMMYFSDIIIEGELDWKDFISHHNNNKTNSNAIGTLMSSEKYKLHVGRIIPDKRKAQLIGEFEEKPDAPLGYSINMAVSIFEPKFLELISDNDISLYGHTVINAMNGGYKFSYYGHDNWLHIQTLNDWYTAQEKYFGIE